jgi:UDP-N-acetylglucosamine 1-carboxyvinyltransferase
MDRLLVTGGTPLDGTVEIAGAKNSALKLMAAVVLSDGRSTVRNVPRIQDCITMVEVLEHLGVGCAWKGDALILDTRDVRSVETPYELVSRMRASILVLGPLLARFGNARVAMPGGCNIGSRSRRWAHGSRPSTGSSWARRPAFAARWSTSTSRASALPRTC